MAPAVMAAALLAASSRQDEKVAMMDDGDANREQDGSSQDENKTFFQKNILDYKEMAKEEFKIPHLLQEREKKMQEEYEERDGVSTDELGITSKQFKQLKELDMMYGGQTSKQELEDIQTEEEQLMLDPYMKKKQRLLTPQ